VDLMTTLMITTRLATVADTTAPVLSAVTAAKTGATAWTGSVSTDEANGTLYWVVTQNATETAATVKAGNDQAVTQTGTQALNGSGLNAETTYRVHVLHRDAGGNDSAVVSSGTFTTDALGSGAGTVAINVLRQMNEMVAPAGVYIELGITGASVAAPASATVDDLQLRKLWSHIDWGDNGATSDKVLNLPAAHNDLNASYAKHCSHVYTAPGSYTITATVRELDGTLVGTDTQVIAISDPDTVFAGNRTILVNAAGQADANHDGAQIVTSADAAVAANKGLPNLRKRVLFKRGETFPTSVALHRFKFGEEENVYFGAYGTGANPIIDSTASGINDNEVFDVTGAHGDDAVFTDLTFVGPHDPDNETGARHVAIAVTDPDSAAQSGQRALVNNCTFQGIYAPLQKLGTGSISTMFLVNNCDIDGWGDYGVFLSDNSQGVVGLTGNRIEQSPNARNGGQGKTTAANRHGPVRMTKDLYFYASGNSMFSRNTWVDNLVGQPCLRLVTSPGRFAAAANIIVERNALEGGSEVIAFADAGGGGGAFAGQRALIEKNLIVGTAQTASMMRADFMGVTFRNNICMMPDVPVFHVNVPSFNIMQKTAGEATTFSGATFATELYANTFVVLKTNANLTDAFSNRRNVVVTDTQGTTAWPGLVVANNAISVPNATGEGLHEAINVTQTAISTVDGTWDARFLGGSTQPQRRGARN
jgi:PKD repeat protein